jgi:hypothetical protein
MTVMITGAFYSEYEVYKIKDSELNQFTKDITKLANGEDADISKYSLITSQDSTSIEDAQKISDIVIYLEDLIEEK